MTEDNTKEVKYLNIAGDIGLRGFHYPRGYDAVKGEFKVDGRAVTVATLHDDPLVVYGEMIRNMWVPSLQDGFVSRLLPVIDPRSKRRIAGVFGDMGSGKSYGAKQLSRIFGADMQIVDCASRDLNFLKSEIVAESGDKSLYYKLESKFGLEPSTIEGLTEVFADAFSYNDGHAAFDRDKLKEKFSKKEIELGKAKEALELACVMEGLPVNASSDLMFNEIPGALLTFKGPLLLDEYTSGLPGTAKSGNMLLEVFAGMTAEHIVPVSSTYSVTVRNKDLKAGQFVIITGNMPKDGLGTGVLDASLYRRIDPVFVGSPPHLDREHRIGQYLTGLPLTTIHKLTDPSVARNDVYFASMLEEMRTMGLDHGEIANIPSHQFALLENWQDTAKAITKLAEFFTEVDRITDPEKVFHDSNIDPDIQHAVTPEYKQQLALDLTIMERVLERAVYQASQNGDNLVENLGSYIAEQVLAVIDEITVPFGENKKPIADHLRTAAETIGIAPPQKFHETEPTSGGLEELLNNKDKDGALRGYDSLTQQVMTMLRQKDGNVPEDYLTSREVFQAVKLLAKEPAIQDGTAVAITGPDIAAGQEEKGQVLQRFVVQDLPVGEEEPTKLASEHLTDLDSFAVAIAFPQVNPGFKVSDLIFETSEQLLEAQKVECATRLEQLGELEVDPADIDARTKIISLTAQLRTAQKVFGDMDSTLKESGVTSCTYACRNDESPDGIAYVHLYVNEHTDKAVMVGDELSPELTNTLAARGVRYISYGSEEATTQFEEALEGVIMSSAGQRPDNGINVGDIKTYLKYATLLRNDAASGIDTQQNFGSIVTNRKALITNNAVEVTNLKTLDELTALRAQLSAGDAGERQAVV